MARSEVSVSIADLPAVKAELELLRASRDRWRDAAELLSERLVRVEAAIDRHADNLTPTQRAAFRRALGDW